MTKAPPYIIKGLLVLSLLAFGISHTSTWLYSDPAKFIVHANKIRKGYFADNLEAHRARAAGEPAAFTQLLTEGGFLFSLALMHAIDPDLPYFFNGLLLPVFLLMVYWLLHLTRAARGPPITFLLFLLLLLFGIPNLRYHISMYCLPYRDMSAHTLALLSLVLGILATRSERPMRLLALSGACLGLGIWFRLAVFLFIPAASIPLFLVARERPARERVKAVLLMGAGGLAGLLPLFGQNLLEGKRFYQSGQMDLMLSSGSLSLEGAGTTTISLANASYNALPQLKLMLVILPWPVWILIAIGVVQSWRTCRLRTLLLLSVALAFILFYACYIKPVPRYIWMADFILLPFAASWIDDAARYLGRNKPRGLKVGTAGLVLALSGLCLHASLAEDAFNRARRTPRDTQRFTRWIDRELPDAAALVCGSHALRGWAENYGPRDLHVLPYWAIDDPPELPLTRKGRDLPLYLLNLYDRRDRRMPSVWRNDIQNHFELKPESDKCWVKQMPFEALSLEEVIPRARARMTIPITGPEQDMVHLELHAARTKTQPVRITSGGGKPLWEGTLNRGPNIFSLPRPASPDLYIESDQPLPPLKYIHFEATPTIRYDYKYYSEIPSVSNYVSRVKMLVYGYSEWHRDWGHVARKKKYPGFQSRPVFRVEEGSAWRIPTQPGRLSLRVYYTARLHDDLADTDAAKPMQDLNRFYYTYAGEAVACTTYYVGPTYRSGKYKELDVVHELWIPVSRQDETPVVLHRDAVAIPYDVILLRTEYVSRGDAYQAPYPPGSTLRLKATGRKWAHGIPGNAWSRLRSRIEEETKP